MLPLIKRYPIKMRIKNIKKAEPIKHPIELKPLSDEARIACMPPKPEDLVGALHGRIHKDLGKSRPVKAIKIKKKEKTNNELA